MLSTARAGDAAAAGTNAAAGRRPAAPWETQQARIIMPDGGVHPSIASTECRTHIRYRLGPVSGRRSGTRHEPPLDDDECPMGRAVADADFPVLAVQGGRRCARELSERVERAAPRVSCVSGALRECAGAGWGGVLAAPVCARAPRRRGCSRPRLRLLLPTSLASPTYAARSGEDAGWRRDRHARRQRGWGSE